MSDGSILPVAEKKATPERQAAPQRDVVMQDRREGGGAAPRRSQPDRSSHYERNRANGTRIHIGTVEVRTIVSQSSLSERTNHAPERIVERVAPQSKNSAPVERLSRPQAWSFGLVQG